MTTMTTTSIAMTNLMTGKMESHVFRTMLNIFSQQGK
jgi:hypothetical protein